MVIDMKEKRSKLLNNALNDEMKTKYDLSIIFATKEKFPGFKAWNEEIKENQTEEEIIDLYNKMGRLNTAYSYITGIGGLIDLDFDWEWTYHVALRHFGERMNTRTIKTPNGGYRSLFIVNNPDDYLKFKERPPKVEIHGKSTHHVIVHGKGKKDDGKLGKYILVNDSDIREDNEILDDMKAFLTAINQKCYFLEYPCISKVLKRKNNELTQEHRTSIGAFFAAEGINMKTAIEFYRCTDDFDYEKTEYHLGLIYEKEFKHPTCKTLRKNFNHPEELCKGCKRISGDLKMLSSGKNEPKLEENKQYKIQLEYPTKHLMGFDDLESATALFGNEYKLIFKVLWYNLLSYKIRISNIRAGRIKPDGRVSVLFVINSGRGKGEIKRVIKDFVKYFEDNVREPTSLHAEQLVGKSVYIKKEKKHEERRGYLSADFLIIDEAYNLLSSGELHYSEARKYLRTALDPYPHNTVSKQLTELGENHALEYEPKCPIDLFVQPIMFENDTLILEGDLRRFIVVYVSMGGIDKTESLKKRLFDMNDDEDAINHFCEKVNSLDQFDSFTLSDRSKNLFFELSLALISRGELYSKKINNFMEMDAFTLQNSLLKFSAIQAFQNGRDVIESEDVELAFIDLFEINEHTYQFIESKIPGNLDYGDGWQGARLKDQEALRWLYERNALDKNNALALSDYLNEIMNIFNVKERRAYDILKSHYEKLWIQKGKNQDGKTVWLKFTPEDSCTNCNMQSGTNSNNEIIKIDQSMSKYYYLINKYDKLINNTHLTPVQTAISASDIDQEDW